MLKHCKCLLIEFVSEQSSNFICILQELTILFHNLHDYIEEKFNDMNNKYSELKATLSNDTIEKFKEILKE